MTEFKRSALRQPSPMAVIVRVALEAHIESLGRKRAERFLRAMSDKLVSEDKLAEVFPIRPRSDDEALLQARREAVEWWRQQLPNLMSRL